MPVARDRTLRSLLFAAATNARHVEKALAGPADAVAVDLEDAVAIGEKARARTAVVALLTKPRTKPLFVRVNGLDTAHALDDFVALGDALPDGVLLPKVESPDALRTADWMLGTLERRSGVASGSVELVALVETAKGIAHSAAIAVACPRVRRLIFGAVDLALDMDLDLNDEAVSLGPARFAVALASRQAGLLGPLDTAFVDIDDLDGLGASAMRARRLGYSGKCCIHPGQVDAVNAAFTPPERELERARRIVAAFAEAERAGSAAIRVDGEMVDYPMVVRARRLLAGSKE